MTKPKDTKPDADSLRCSTFVEHRDKTVADLESVATMLGALIDEVKQGDVKAFDRFWIQGGTEEGDATIFRVREMLLGMWFAKKRLLAIRRTTNDQPVGV